MLKRNNKNFITKVRKFLNESDDDFEFVDEDGMSLYDDFEFFDDDEIGEGGEISIEQIKNDPNLSDEEKAELISFFENQSSSDEIVDLGSQRAREESKGKTFDKSKLVSIGIHNNSHNKNQPFFQLQNPGRIKLYSL
jgi:hypothetical protein